MALANAHSRLKRLLTFTSTDRQGQMRIFGQGKWRVTNDSVTSNGHSVAVVRGNVLDFHGIEGERNIAVGTFASNGKEREGEIITILTVTTDRLVKFSPVRWPIDEGTISSTDPRLTKFELVIGWPNDYSFGVIITDHTHAQQSDSDVWRWRVGTTVDIPTMWKTPKKREAFKEIRDREAREYRERQRMGPSTSRNVIAADEHSNDNDEAIDPIAFHSVDQFDPSLDIMKIEIGSFDWDAHEEEGKNERSVTNDTVDNQPVSSTTGVAVQSDEPKPSQARRRIKVREKTFYRDFRVPNWDTETESD